MRARVWVKEAKTEYSMHGRGGAQLTLTLLVPDAGPEVLNAIKDAMSPPLDAAMPRPKSYPLEVIIEDGEIILSDEG